MNFAIFRAVISVGFKGDITLLLCLLAKIKCSISYYQFNKRDIMLHKTLKIFLCSSAMVYYVELI